MNEIRFRVGRGTCSIGMQYDHRKSVLYFENFDVFDKRNEVYLKFVGRKQYLIPIMNMTLDITRPLTEYSGTFDAQLEERKSDGSLVSQSEVFQIHIEKSVKADAEYEVTDERLETIYREYNRMYNVIVETDEQVKQDMADIKSDYSDVKSDLAADYAATKTNLSNEIKAETRAAETRLSDNIEQRAELLNEMVEGLDDDVAEALTEIRAGVSQEVEDLIELIDEQPTAYDVDKVVKELCKCISDNDCADKTREDYAYIGGVIDSIHIVESGGIK